MVNTGKPEIVFKFDMGIGKPRSKDVELLCLMDDYGTVWQNRKEGGGVKKFDTIQQAIDSKEIKETSTGLARLKLLADEFYPKMPILLADLTGSEGLTTNEIFTSERFDTCLMNLESADFSVLCVPFALTSVDFEAYNLFYKQQSRKMKMFGIITQTPPVSTLPTLAPTFNNGGILKLISSKLILDSIKPLSIEESVVYHAGITISNKPNVSETWMALDKVTGEITKDTMSYDDYLILENNGATYIDYLDVNNNILGIVNGNTPAGKDIKVIRSFNHFFNRFRQVLERKYGKDNSLLELMDLMTIVDQLKQEMILKGIVVDARVVTEKPDVDEWGDDVTNMIIASVEIDVYDVIFRYEVDGLLNIV